MDYRIFIDMRHKTKGLVTLAKFLPSFFSITWQCMKHYSHKSHIQIKQLFFWSTHRIRETNLNLETSCKICVGEIFQPHMKFQITWIPIKMTRFRPQTFTEIMLL